MLKNSFIWSSAIVVIFGVVGGMLWTHRAMAAPTPSGFSAYSSCTEDVWDCTAWSGCRADKTETRTCERTLACETSTIAAPTVLRSCGAACSVDSWICTDWEACGSDGKVRRSCALSIDCAGAETPPPDEVLRCGLQPLAPPAPPAPLPPPLLAPAPRSAPSVQSREREAGGRLICAHLPQLHSRVLCRLGLAPEVLELELAIQYLPEPCRAMSDVEAQRACINRTRALQACLTQPVGSERLTCARRILNLQPLAAERDRCEQRLGAARARCEDLLKKRAYPYITFRVDDLIQRAHTLRSLGAPTDYVATLITAAQQGTISFNRATSLEARVNALRSVQTAWHVFVAVLPERTRERARTVVK